MTSRPRSNLIASVFIPLVLRRQRGRRLLAILATVLLTALAGCSSSGSNNSGNSGTPGPTITSLSPAQGGAGATAVVITGTSFGDGQADGSGSVTFSGTPAPVLSWTATQIVVVVPSAATTGNVVVTSSGKASNGSAFQVLGLVVGGPCFGGGLATGANAALFSGSYAYQLTGFKGGGAVGTHFVRTGSVTIAAGAITGGEEDLNITGSANVHHTVVVANSSVFVAADNIGLLTLGFSDSTCAQFSFSIGTFSNINGPAKTATRGHITEFDDATGSSMRASGTLIQQTTSAFVDTALYDNYAFGFEGINSTAGHVTEEGTFTLAPSTASNNVSNGYMDANNAGTQLFPGSTGGLTAGTISATAISANGRMTATLVAEPACSATCTYHYAAYVVTPALILFASTDTVGVNTPLVAGKAIVADEPGLTTGTLANEQISSALGLLLYGSGSNASVAEVELGLFSFNSGTNTLTSSSFVYSNGTVNAPASGAGPYAVSGVGRLTFSINGGSPNFICYMTAVGLQGLPGGVLLDPTVAFCSDGSNAAIGGQLLIHEAAVIAPINDASPASFAFGTVLMGDATVQNQIGVAGVQVTGSGTGATLSGAFDASSEAGLGASTFIGQPFTFDATGAITGPSGTLGFVNGNGIFFIDTSGSAALFVGQQ
jgi:hypothetical protein